MCSPSLSRRPVCPFANNPRLENKWAVKPVNLFGAVQITDANTAICLRRGTTSGFLLIISLPASMCMMIRRQTWHTRACDATCSRERTSAASDPTSGQITLLFNPRTQLWRQHFHWNGPTLMGLSPEGRATIALMQMNAPERIRVRNRKLDFIPRSYGLNSQVFLYGCGYLAS